MKLHPPFMISARLLPALKIGDATLSLVKVEQSGDRQRATFALDIPGQEEYLERELQSGCGGFRGGVEIFKTFLTFASACAESMNCARGTRKEAHADPDSNASLFPFRIADWMADNQSEIDYTQFSICTDDDHCQPNESLIED